MEARLIRAAILAASLLSLGASYRTQNFLVTAPTPELAQQVATSAEAFRRDLAIEWLGDELPPWGEVCPITVQVGPGMGAGGATSFMFVGGRPTGWTMTVQGTPERVLDSVLPHEVSHTVFATHFGRPLPRWADEGACTTVEHSVEREKQHRLLYEFLSTGRGIAFNQMFAMKEYPPDVLPLYSQGYSLARFLIAQGGKQKFMAYVGDGMDWNNWTKATEHHYGYRSLSELQVTWVDWVRRGSPELPPVDSQTQLASAPSAPATQGVPDASELALANQSPVKLASTSGSWYARVRDENRSATVSAPPQARPQARPAHPLHQAVGQALTAAPPAADPTSAHPQLVTRPQPLERAEQRVLEWSRPHAASAPPTQLR